MKTLSRKSLLTILMVCAVSIPLIAEGIQEEQEQVEYGRRAYQDRELEDISVTGAIQFTLSHPKLVSSNGDEYSLLYPMFLADNIEINDGDNITVVGQIVPGPVRQADNDTAYLRVGKVSFDGKEYDLDSLSPMGPSGHHTRFPAAHMDFRTQRGYGQKPYGTGRNETRDYRPGQRQDEFSYPRQNFQGRW